MFSYPNKPHASLRTSAPKNSQTATFKVNLNPLFTWTPHSELQPLRVFTHKRTSPVWVTRLAGLLTSRRVRRWCAQVRWHLSGRRVATPGGWWVAPPPPTTHNDSWCGGERPPTVKWQSSVTVPGGDEPQRVMTSAPQNFRPISLLSQFSPNLNIYYINV